MIWFCIVFISWKWMLFGFHLKKNKNQPVNRVIKSWPTSILYRFKYLLWQQQQRNNKMRQEEMKKKKHERMVEKKNWWRIQFECPFLHFTVVSSFITSMVLYFSSFFFLHISRHNNFVFFLLFIRCLLHCLNRQINCEHIFT